MKTLVGAVPRNLLDEIFLRRELTIFFGKQHYIKKNLRTPTHLEDGLKVGGFFVIIDIIQTG